MLLVFDGELAARDTLRFAEEKAGFGLWQIKFETNVLTCSPNSLRLLGLPSDTRRETDDKLTLASIEAVVHPEDRHVLTELRHAMTQSLPFNCQFRVVHRNGRVRALAVHGEVLVDGDGRRAKAIGVLVDITHQTESLLASHLITERLRTLIKGIDGAIWIAQSDGKNLDLVFDLFERRASSRGKDWLELVHPADRDKLIANWNKSIAQDAAFVEEYRAQGSDGSYRWRRTYAVPMSGEGGAHKEWIGLSVSIEQSRSAVNNSQLINGAQVRAARAFLNWSMKDLADRAGLTIGVVRRIEDSDGASERDVSIVAKIKDSLSAGGVDFYSTSDGRACVASQIEGRM